MANEHFIEVSDGSILRILKADCISDVNAYTLLFLGGWGTLANCWEDILIEVSKSFNLIYVETREKHTSKLTSTAWNDLNRISTDIEEIIESLELDETKLVIYASSWGTAIAADGLSKSKFTPFLTVFLCPTEKMPIPYLASYLIAILPTFILQLVLPFSIFWLQGFKSSSNLQRKKYIKVLQMADSKKWISVGRHVARKNFLELYENVKCDSLFIASDDDKMHDINESIKIAKLIANSKFVNMGKFDDFDSPLVVDVIRQHLKHMRLNTDMRS